jgi:hypothetical protein
MMASARVTGHSIVAKHRDGLYDTRKPAWIKIKNPDYSQKEGRVELFEELRT